MGVTRSAPAWKHGTQCDRGGAVGVEGFVEEGDRGSGLRSATMKEEASVRTPSQNTGNSSIEAALSLGKALRGIEPTVGLTRSNRKRGMRLKTLSRDTVGTVINRRAPFWAWGSTHTARTVHTVHTDNTRCENAIESYCPLAGSHTTPDLACPAHPSNTAPPPSQPLRLAHLQRRVHCGPFSVGLLLFIV
jgi:hypothetical protein